MRPRRYYLVLESCRCSGLAPRQGSLWAAPRADCLSSRLPYVMPPARRRLQGTPSLAGFGICARKLLGRRAHAASVWTTRSFYALRPTPLLEMGLSIHT